MKDICINCIHKGVCFMEKDCVIKCDKYIPITELSKVVRCKDCKYSSKSSNSTHALFQYRCKRNESLIGAYDYCSKGEKYE